jgi:hypothetical protein
MDTLLPHPRSHLLRGEVTGIGDGNGDAGHPDGSATVETSVSMDEGGSGFMSKIPPLLK